MNKSVFIQKVKLSFLKPEAGPRPFDESCSGRSLPPFRHEVDILAAIYGSTRCTQTPRQLPAGTKLRKGGRRQCDHGYISSSVHRPSGRSDSEEKCGEVVV